MVTKALNASALRSSSNLIIDSNTLAVYTGWLLLSCCISVRAFFLFSKLSLGFDKIPIGVLERRSTAATIAAASLKLPASSLTLSKTSFSIKP